MVVLTAAAYSAASAAEREGMPGPDPPRQGLRALALPVRHLRRAAGGAGVLRGGEEHEGAVLRRRLHQFLLQQRFCAEAEGALHAAGD